MEEAVVTNSPDSVRIVTVAEGAVLPEMVTELSVVRSSSAGLVIVKGVGGMGVVEISGVGEGAGVGVMVAAAWRRLLLAVQMPNVMTKPTAKPIKMARMTSFFTMALRLTTDAGIVKKLKRGYCGSNIFRPLEF